ncbi:hypothetical protein K9M42_02625 [Patescibacteria group bacterium]|nr:hypothetical protein [Patescibacteria group bacterium]
MNLLLTLGHNSSVIGIKNDGEIIAGYEEERLTRKKSDSGFPNKAINKIFEFNKPNKEEENIIYISHWFDDYNFIENKSVSEKHFDYDFIEKLKNDFRFKIVVLSEDFTHHDAHAKSVLSFYRQNGGNNEPHILVADGFGNKQEVLSLYKVKNNKIIKLKSIFGYGCSLGLMYQYATSFCGMKENQDEYKFLGYESHIKEILSIEEIIRLKRNAKFIADNLFTGMFFPNNLVNNHNYLFVSKQIGLDHNKEINNELLVKIKESWYYIFDYITKNLYERIYPFEKRVLIGFLIQKIIEEVNKSIIKEFNIKEILVAGGIYYNVKLNNSILNEVNEFSVIPLTGDQGAAIGLFEEKSNLIFNFKDLCIGKRNLHVSDKQIQELKKLKNFKYFVDEKDMINFIVKNINKNNIVQVITGNMEFGPRALCNTSTLALPYLENVEYINKLNGRSTVMPMAPIVLRKNMKNLFNEEQEKKVIGSDKYMILTYDYKDEVDIEKYRGVMHNYPLENKYSGRPQVIDDNNSYIYKVLDKVNSLALINTSYNVHGQPIVRTIEDAIIDYKFQLEKQKNMNNNNNNKEIFLIIFGG